MAARLSSVTTTCVNIPINHKNTAFNGVERFFPNEMVGIKNVLTSLCAELRVQ